MIADSCRVCLVMSSSTWLLSKLGPKLFPSDGSHADALGHHNGQTRPGTGADTVAKVVRGLKALNQMKTSFLYVFVAP